MAFKICAYSIGALILGAGLYDLSTEKHGEESRKIYPVTSIIGGVIFPGDFVLTIPEAAA